MSEKEVFDYIKSVITKEYVDEKIQKNEVFGINAKDIADHFNIYRSTVSALLNDAVKKGSYIKIDTRPVLFIPVDLLLKEYGFVNEKSVYSADEFKTLFKKDSVSEDPFSVLIGYEGSQSVQVKQGQSAILYPPKGLHTLITGESGTGKTLFARTMYNYGRKIKKLSEKEYPFVEFNCADYYHNPQLLLSHLFGHIRGAFTGADQETVGLVEKANHGILFLDEIHRLPPEGQELLFYLMDTGQYRKMGEASTVRKADVLIIGATTENPNDVLLKTFKRRIPLTIGMPPFRERPLLERLKMTEHLFAKEAVVTQRTYIIESDIIKAITSYDFPENIGQLASEIKILCARSFLENRSENASEEIKVPFKFLSDDIKNAYKSDRKNGFVFTDSLSNYNYDLIISPSKEVQHLLGKVLDEESYYNIVEEISDYSNKGLSSEEVAKKIDSAVLTYYNDVLNKMYFKTLNKEEIYKIIDPEVLDFSIDVMKDVRNNLNVKITEQNILVLAFHLKFLIDRLRKMKPIMTTSSVEDTYNPVVDQMIEKIENKFKIQLPEDEKKFFQSLIKNITENVETDQKSTAALYILAHGSTASSIASVCNRLLHTNFAKAFDMPLTESVTESYASFKEEIMRLNPANGVMILADMGSLLTFGPKLTKETGIPTHTIPNVSTAIALDIAHIMLNRNEHVDFIYNDYLIKNTLEPEMAKTLKKPAIISACSSGIGTSMAFKETIEDILNKNKMNYIKVFAFNNGELQHRGEEFQKIEREYNILAIVGNIHIDIDYPFFHIAELISNEKKERFTEFLSKVGFTSEIPDDEKPKDTIDDAFQFLAKHVMYVNPYAVKKVAPLFVDAIFNVLNYEHEEIDSVRFTLMIHLGFMIERVIARKFVVFDNSEKFMEANMDVFKKIRKQMSIIEDAFEIDVNDDEICYIIVTLYPQFFDVMTNVL